LAAVPIPNYDVMVAGAGAVGLSFAAALKQALGRGAKILVVAPRESQSASRDRAVAVAQGPRRMLERIGAWAAVAPHAQPIVRMTVTDGRVREAVRPIQLRFDGARGAPLAHMAFNADVVASLTELCARLGVERLDDAVSGITPQRNVVEAHFESGTSARVRLAVAADGARSKLRRIAGIATIGGSYPQ